MKKLIMIALSALLSAPMATAAPDQGAGWDWQLSGRITIPKVRAFDIDPDEISTKRVKRLVKSGKYMICYISVGTVENWRSDAKKFPAKIVGKSYDGWPGEKFLDIRRTDVLLPLMRARFQKCKSKGFHAIEPDNMDVHSNNSGFPITKQHTLNYVRELVKIARSMGLEIGQKNTPELSLQLMPIMDFAITESCYQDKWCKYISRDYGAVGKPIFDAEYNDRKINFKRACQAAKSQGISMILKDRNLTNWMRACPK